MMSQVHTRPQGRLLGALSPSWKSPPLRWDGPVATYRPHVIVASTPPSTPQSVRVRMVNSRVALAGDDQVRPPCGPLGRSMLSPPEPARRTPQPSVNNPRFCFISGAERNVHVVLHSDYSSSDWRRHPGRTARREPCPSRTRHPPSPLD